MIVGSEGLKGLEKRVTMVDGGFDPLHPGHLAYFRAAARLGLPLLCNVRDDTYLTATKGRPPLLSQHARAELLDSLQTVSYVHLCSTSTADALERLRPAVYAKGADWEGRLPKAETELCAREGIRIVFLDTASGSSTQIVRDFLENMRRHRVPDPRALDPSDVRVIPSEQRAFGCIGSTHMNRYLSGVARFNHLLAERFGVRCLTFTEAAVLGQPPLLLSVKLTDCSATELRAFEAATARLAARAVPYALFLHSFGASPLEFRLAFGASAVFAGNDEIASLLSEAGVGPQAVWCPSLLDREVLPETIGLTLFSFGMSHKMQLGQYHRLRGLLEAWEMGHTLLVSTAFHEKASFGDMDAISDGFREIFGADAHLLGFLSDPAIGHFLTRSDLFCAFFPSGVRSNNTSVAAAMSQGTPVLTNLDRHSPAWMLHGHNVLDITRLEKGDLTHNKLTRIARQALRDVEINAGWDALASALSRSAIRVPGSSQEYAGDGPGAGAVREPDFSVRP